MKNIIFSIDRYFDTNKKMYQLTVTTCGFEPMVLKQENYKTASYKEKRIWNALMNSFKDSSKSCASYTGSVEEFELIHSFSKIGVPEFKNSPEFVAQFVGKLHSMLANCSNIYIYYDSPCKNGVDSNRVRLMVDSIYILSLGDNESLKDKSVCRVHSYYSTSNILYKEIFHMKNLVVSFDGTEYLKNIPDNFTDEGKSNGKYLGD